MNLKERDYYFDNLRGFLIICVIIGNSIEYLYTPNIDTDYFLLFLYMFHMPMLTFISGYFCKKSKRTTQEKVIDTLTIYLFAQSFYYLFNKFYMESTLSFQVFYPTWTLWYLLALSVWYIISDYIVNNKRAFIISIFLALIVGFDTSIGSYATISRIFFFLPFFIAGMSFDKNKIVSKLKKHKIVLLVSSIIVLFVLHHFVNTIDLEYLFEYCNYKSYENSAIIPLLTRVFHYIGGFTLLFFFLMIFSSKKSIVSWIGKNSLIFYVCHSGVIKILSKSKYNILKYDTLFQLIKSEFIVIITLSMVTYVYLKIKVIIKENINKIKLNIDNNNKAII